MLDDCVHEANKCLTRIETGRVVREAISLIESRGNRPGSRSRWRRRAVPFRGRTIAVTGAAGFLGSRLVARLAADDCRIVRVARCGAAAAGRSVGRHRDRCDWRCRRSRRLGSVADADVIFHFAAQTSTRPPPISGWDFSRQRDADAPPAGGVPPARRRPMVLFAGTATAAGIPSRLPVDEDAPDNPSRSTTSTIDGGGRSEGRGLARRRVAEPRCGWRTSMGLERTAAGAIVMC